MYTEGEFTFFPKNTTTSRLNFTKLGFMNFLVLNNNGTLNELNTSFSYQFNFKNTTFISTSISRTEANVPVSFSFDDGSNVDCVPLPAANYVFSSAKALWESDTRKVLGWSAECTGGEFYNGTQVGASLGLRYRVQPWGSFRFAAEYNALRFPAPYCGATLFNLTPRIEIFFNRKINWTTFIQYNTQSDNFNINSRLQWRFRPMSDIFLVYTDNYAVQFWGPKNRALVAKVSYWW
jgi:hypothetical protein